MQAVSARRVSGKMRFPVSRASSPDAGEMAFVFAKASGIIGRSFVGKKVSALEKIRSLSELDRLIFSGTAESPGREPLRKQELLINLEKRILKRTVQQIRSVINSFSGPPELLILQLRSCEYADLKTCLHNISSGKGIPPLLSDIGRFRTVNFNAYPDIAAMVAGTEFEFILKNNVNAIKSPGYDFTPLEAEIDLHYYTLLVQSLHDLSANDSLCAGQILADEISLRNCAWALRLSTYFKKRTGETAKYLMDQKMPPASGVIPGRIRPRFTDSAGETSLAAEAFEMLHFSLDTRSDWNGWRWESMLNPEKPGEHWAADPRYFQNAASRYINRLTLHCFRLASFSVSSVFCFIKLKQFEEDILTSIAEGLGLGMTGKDVFNLLEAPV